jgi:predicted DNA-binding transcriptional regulator AlpA
VTVTIHPIAVDDLTAAEMLGGLARSTFHERVRDGSLPKPRRLGGRNMWLVEELLEAVRALPVNDGMPPPKPAKAA